ncbi:MAG: hypothetical protein A2V86_12270 [Deltaproteobacteria bacterium RBG_16_49_23]|nr:MAG: hypothetical protein A2V86_12270 [Deltaproteobacteria bacterium RBG_16_49_23]
MGLKNSIQRYLKFPNDPLPLRRGRVRVGVDKIETIWSPLPFIPSRREAVSQCVNWDVCHSERSEESNDFN